MIDLLSYALGLLAWLIPIRAMQKKHIDKGYHYIVLSLAACTISLQIQLFRIIYSLYTTEGGLDDALFQSVSQKSAIMIGGTVLLVAISIFVKRKNISTTKEQQK